MTNQLVHHPTVVGGSDSASPVTVSTAMAATASSTFTSISTSTSTSVSLEQVLQDATLSIPRERWFELVQDIGDEMTEQEYALYGVRAKGKPKLKTRKISYGNRFFANLYTLSSELYNLLDSRRETTFTRLPKPASKTACIHSLGQWIADKRDRYGRGDIHSIGRDVEFMDLIQSPTYAECDQYYILSQTEVLKYLFEKYGAKGEEKVATIDDKVRVAGILFLEDMRPFIQDMVGATRASRCRSVLDAASSRKQYGLKQLHEKFIDEEIVVDLPPGWDSEENKASVDEINGAGAFEQFGRFNPNHHGRMKLNWTQAEINAIFAKVVVEYNAAMDKYTKGTGGGSGSSMLFGVWDEAQAEQHKKWRERPVGWIAQYAGQMSMLYLGVVLMWDAQYSYIFVTPKDPMPVHCQIDDAFDAGGGDADDLDPKYSKA